MVLMNGILLIHVKFAAETRLIIEQDQVLKAQSWLSSKSTN